MSTNWLLTWNPKKWQWPECMLSEIGIRSMNGEIIAGNQSWSVSNTRRVQLGDKVYLMRQGQDQPGLIASGIALSSPWPADHWSGSGDPANYIDIAWTAIIDPDSLSPLPRAELKTGLTDHVNWSTQRSGISIDNAHPGAAKELEDKWEAHLLQVWSKSPDMGKRNREAVEQASSWREFEVCRQLFAEEDWQGVIDGLTDLAKSNSLEKFHLLLGDAHQKKEEYGKAIEAYSEAIKISPKSYLALIQRAICCLETEDYKQVIEDCDNARPIDKESIDPPFFRGLAHQFLGDHKEAIKDFTTAIEIYPDFDVGYYYRGVSYQEIGDENKAQADFEKEKELNPDAEDPSEKSEASEEEDFEKTIAELSKAIESLLKDDDAHEIADAYHQRGISYYCSDEYDKALADFDKAIEKDPDVAVFHYNKGLAHWAKNEFDRVIRDSSEAIRLDRDEPDAYMLRASAYEHLAEADIKKAKELGFEEEAG